MTARETGRERGRKDLRTPDYWEHIRRIVDKCPPATLEELASVHAIFQP